MIMHSYGAYKIKDVEEMDAIEFLQIIRVIQKRDAETILMNAHITTMVNANEEAWDSFKTSLGFGSNSLIVNAIKNNIETSDERLKQLKESMK